MKRVSIKDVAQEAGVSTATVSYVLNASPNQTISPETVRRVHEAVKKLNYVPNQAAMSLKSRRTHLIGIVIPQTEPGKELMFSNPFYGELLSQIEYTARMMGYHILLTGTENNESYIGIARNRAVDGLIIIGAYPDEWLNELHQLSIPVVLIDTYMKDSVFHTIGIDDRAGGRMAVEYLLGKGHRNIAFLSGRIEESGVVYQRYRGYMDALQAAGLPLDEKKLYCGSISFEYGEAAAEETLRRGQGETAVFATADILACGFMKGLHEKGLRVPEDYSVIGFDDLNLARMCTPMLTTIHQDIGIKGQIAIQFIMESLEGDTEKKENILPIHLIERETVRAI